MICGVTAELVMVLECERVSFIFQLPRNVFRIHLYTHVKVKERESAGGLKHRG